LEWTIPASCAFVNLVSTAFETEQIKYYYYPYIYPDWYLRLKSMYGNPQKFTPMVIPDVISPMYGDYVTIAGTRYTGSASIRITVPQSTIVHFHSDWGNTKSGFVLQWTCGKSSHISLKHVFSALPVEWCFARHNLDLK